MIFWVYVSQDFDVDKLIGRLFETIVRKKSNLQVEQNMPREISNKLGGKKFLLVLDDAWHRAKRGWEQFMVNLKSGAPGSKILLTTRDLKVAEIVKSRHIFELGMLSEDESWSLFLKSSGCVEEDLGFQYIEVGKEILNRCSGVPLAIRTLGGILSENKEISIRCKGLVTFPESIGKLRKLRTLELNYADDLESLPQSIGDCQDLQSLILYPCRKIREIPGTICKIKNLRALHISECSFLKQFPSEFTGVFSNLQTINLANATQFQELPSTLSCPLLCTLDLSRTKVTMLPPWVTTIGTLECINLEFCFKLVELPKGIGSLKRLAVLNIKGCSKLRCVPSGIGKLTRLTQLGLFVVGCGRDDARISELENLDRLSGKLEIRNLKYLKDPCDAKKACLKQKNGIKTLVLDWSLDKEEKELASDVEQEQGVLSALEPPSQIESLKIKGYQGPCLPRWLMEQIGHLTSLESLDLVYCGALAELPEGIGQLSALRRLFIQGCPALQCLPQSIQRLTALQSLVIAECRALASRYKQGVGPEWHLISHIPFVRIS
ncbi:hypothetical protein PVAP13_8KG095860 [Panicum virgatum]|uniref:NB-ARC domain-containing protein n=2 Tax=Panicum virgatum TaxID=38727 RepID=A0A8T0PP79_PANVG|nr:hypothetical protein PVAP13_8KG095860 [Panicum virgatum]KAG2560877.1 hypothetical protein PVAP13_8KG095860 [Panicum virgatum]